MNTLIVTAHPSSKGFTHKIAEKYKSMAELKGGSVEILDLYDKKWTQEYLSFEDKKNIVLSSVTKLIQEKIVWANELVFVFPVWWYESPAILKNFYDVNFSAKFAFRYLRNGFPEGLLKGRTAKIFVTAGGPKFYYWFVGMPFKKSWKMRLSFCGIKLKKFVFFGGMDKASDEKKEECLKVVGNSV